MLKVLLVAEQINPQWTSVPLVAFRLYDALRQIADVHLVAHARNRPDLEAVRGEHVIDYIEEGFLARTASALADKLANRSGANWPLLHTLAYPVYAGFNAGVARRFAGAVTAGRYDVVHALTPILPRYPYSLARIPRRAPFVLGPVNGGIPFPPGFAAVGRREFSRFNFLRRLGRCLPGYLATYRQADLVLAGSLFTRDFVRDSLGVPENRLETLAENGVGPELFDIVRPRPRTGRVHLLFVGRLAPYKGADMVLDALAGLPPQLRSAARLTLVGDGPERPALEAQARERGIADQTHFAGWVHNREVAGFLADADVFCFPSVREFGGAVVLEAMAAGLPAIVADYGGIAEYMDAASGFKIAPVSRETVVAGVGDALARLVADEALRERMGQAARERARGYAWEAKAARLLALYQQTIAARAQGQRP